MREVLLERVPVPCDTLGLFDTADVVEIDVVVHMYNDATWDVDTIGAGSRDLTKVINENNWDQIRTCLTPHVNVALEEWLGDELAEMRRDMHWEAHIERITLERQEERQWSLE